MLDINFIRKNAEKVRIGAQKKKIDPKLIDKFMRLDSIWRAKTSALDQLKSEQNLLNKEFSVHPKQEDLLTKAQVLKKRITDISAERDILQKKRDAILLQLPNIPFDNVPVGEDAQGNIVVREVGKKPKFAFEPSDYLSIAEKLGLVNTKIAAEVSGSRFGYLMREGALLEFALLRIALDVALPRGFIPVIPPVMIRPKVFEGIGRLAADQKDERYYLEKDDLYLIGSAEHTLAPIHMNETLKEGELPKRYIGFSTCFRREAGSYGKDTKGILRVHQFDKVELFSFTKPEDSEREHLFLLSMQEEMMKKLEIPYRVVEVCSGDMGWTDARQFDIEAWFPSEGIYRETHSCSNTTDFQARGIGVKFETKDKKKEYVHMLNATAFSQRPILAIIENFQTKSGRVKIPTALRGYVGKSEIER